jgi:hypothetical protein
LGEVAINTYDGKLYYKKSGSVESVETIVTTDSITSGSITISEDLTIQRDIYLGGFLVSNGDIDAGGDLSGSGLQINDTLKINRESLQFTGSAIVTGSLTVLGEINARQFNINIISSSIIFASGSTKFGDSEDDIMSVTGSIETTGTITANAFVGDGSGIINLNLDSELPKNGYDYNIDDVATISDFNTISTKYIIDFRNEVLTGTPVGQITYIANSSGNAQIVPGSDKIYLISEDVEAGYITADGFDGNIVGIGNPTNFSSSVDNRIKNISTNLFATTGSNTFNGNEIISGSLFVSGTTEFGGDLVPKTARGATLGTSDRPFRDIWLQSASINIASDTPGGRNATISNADGNVTIKAAGFQLKSGSFIAFEVSEDARVKIKVPNIPAGDIGAFSIIGNASGSYQPITSPGGMVHITGNDGLVNRLNMDAFGSGSTTSFNGIIARAARGTAANPTQTKAGDVTLRLTGTGWRGDTGFGGDTIVGGTTTAIEFVALEDQMNNARGSAQQFYNAPIGTRNRVLSAQIDATGINLPTGSDFKIGGVSYSASLLTTTFYQTDSASFNGRINAASNEALNNTTASFKQAFSVSGSNVTIIGNLYVSGSTTTINSTQIDLSGSTLKLDAGAPVNAGIQVHDTLHANTTASFIYDTTNTVWKIGPYGSEIEIATINYVTSSTQTLSASLFQTDSTQSYQIIANATTASNYSASLATSISASNFNITNNSSSFYTNINNLSSSISTSIGIDRGNITITSASAWGAFQSASSYSGSLATSISASNYNITINSASVSLLSSSFNNRIGTIEGKTLISGSSQVLNGSGIWSSSVQMPTGVVSGSSQILNGSGIYSSSAQLPAGLISSSAQLTSSLDGRYAITGSNTFIGNETISGSLSISGSTQHNGNVNITGSIVMDATSQTNILKTSITNPSAYVIHTFQTASYSGASYMFSAIEVSSGKSTTYNILVAQGNNKVSNIQTYLIKSEGSSPNTTITTAINAGNVELRVTDTGTFTYRGIVQLF